MFKNLFKKQAYEPLQQDSQAEQSAPAERPVTFVSTAVAPGTEIRYHPDLITRLQGHHIALLKLFGAVKTHAMNDEFADALKSMQSFRQALTTHLLEENVKLYTYLAKCLDADPDNRDLMMDMKSEMGKIGTVVMRFLNQYTNSGITPFNKKQFLEKLDEIGPALVDRIEREESSLYTMYMPPEAFK